VLDDTLAGVLDEYPEVATMCAVPLGVSRYSTEKNMRPHTVAEARAVVEVVERWQATFLEVLGRRLVFAADEYYLQAGVAFPAPEAYDGFPQHENGVGIARTFEAEFTGGVDVATGVKPGFFAWVDGAPAEGYRAPRAPGSVTLVPRREAPVGVLTGAYGAAVLGPLVASLGRDDVRVIPVANEFFGGNIAVAGLMVGADLQRVLAAEPEGHRYLLPDVCLSNGTFLDGTTPADLPRPVEIVPTDGHALRAALTKEPVFA
jgi:NifB/MoaA-like Fe-S oxidoreductase